MNAKRKGKRGELEFATLCRAFGFPARRGQQYRGGPDSPDVLGLPFLHVEVKRRERLNLDEAMEQSVREAAKGEIPVVAHRKNRRGWLITLRVADFFLLYRAYLQQKGVGGEDAEQEPSHHLCGHFGAQGVGEEPSEERSGS
ncbi:hypothetical protein [Candidatus Caldatribacterium sp.]|uniref:hypothetical protein n=1 Tax=Candidatus Caldatribacterium sp. TaxID=2282143 RepID=UPI003873312C